MFRIVLILSAALFATPALAQERQWVLDVAGEDVFLAFGVPSTNDVGVSFWCKIGKKDVSLFSPLVNSEKHPKLKLAVGSRNFSLVAKINDNEGAKTIEALLKPQNKILDALETEERFEVSIGKHTVTYPLADADFKGMMKLCNGEVAPTEN
jgi:hypothetical protein